MDTKITKFYSPLRFPGGKHKYWRYFKEILNQDKNIDTFVEVFAGGAGLGLALLSKNLINKLIINDLDPYIHALWYEILNNHKKLIGKIEHTKPTVDEFKKRRNTYLSNPNGNELSMFIKAFTCLFVNRTTRSGIAKAGPIGGYKQEGNYPINCRWDQKMLIQKINNINAMSDRIELYNMDYYSFIDSHSELDNHRLIFIDPPYYKNGKELYVYHFKTNDHLKLASQLNKMRKTHKWVLTYDNCLEIEEIFSFSKRKEGGLNYSIAGNKLRKELIFFSDIMKIKSGKFGPIQFNTKRRQNGYMNSKIKIITK